MAELRKNPSDIAQAADKFLNQLKLSAKSKACYDEVLWLFIESLKGDPSSVVETEDGAYVLAANWDSFYGGAIDNFLDWWLQRKYMGSDEVLQRAPGILKKFIQWSYANKYFDQERYEDFMLALPAGKSKDLKRLQELGELFYRLHSPDPGAWARGEYGKVQSLHQAKRPEAIEEGYMEFEAAKDGDGFFRFEKQKIGPVKLSAEITKLLKKGDTVNLTVGKYGSNWQVLETGNVYAEGTIF